LVDRHNSSRTIYDSAIAALVFRGNVGAPEKGPRGRSVAVAIRLRVIISLDDRLCLGRSKSYAKSWGETKMAGLEEKQP
jgi:hypothetical protein